MEGELIGTAEITRILGRDKATVLRRITASVLVLAMKLSGPNGAYAFKRGDRLSAFEWFQLNTKTSPMRPKPKPKMKPVGRVVLPSQFAIHNPSARTTNKCNSGSTVFAMSHSACAYGLNWLIRSPSSALLASPTLLQAR